MEATLSKLVTLLSSIAHQLAERVRAVARIASRERPADPDVARLFELPLDLMGVASLDGTILRVNPGFERVLGLAPEEILGRRLVEIVHPDDREATAAVFAGVLESGELSVFENRLPAADGSTISAVAGSAVAAGLVVGMLFEGWLDSILPSARARLAKTAGVASTTVLLYVGLRAYAHAVGWTHAEPEEWIAYAGLNAIGAGVILHVAIGHRWPFASPEESAAMT